MWLKKGFLTKEQLRQKFGSKKFLVEIIIGINGFLSGKKFGGKNFVVKKKFWSKNCLLKKNFGRKNFWSKIFLVKIFFARTFLFLGSLYLKLFVISQVCVQNFRPSFL